MTNRDNQSTSSKKSANESTSGELVRVLCFKFKDTASKAEIDSVISAFRALPEQISEISSFRSGRNISKAQRNKGLTHCFVLIFNSEQDLDRYAHHAAHLSFVQRLVPLLADGFEVDFLEND